MELTKKNEVVTYDKIEVPNGEYYGYVDDTNDSDAHRYFRMVIDGETMDVLSIAIIGSNDVAIRKYVDYDFGWHIEKIFTNHPKAKFITKEEFWAKHTDIYLLLNKEQEDKNQSL